MLIVFPSQAAENQQQIKHLLIKKSNFGLSIMVIMLGGKITMKHGFHGDHVCNFFIFQLPIILQKASIEQVYIW